MADEINTGIADWRNAITESQEVFKLRDSETAEITFQNDGEIINNEFGKSIVFNIVDSEGNKKAWFVNPQNFSLLGQIKKLGTPLIDVKIRVSRTGEKRSDTRYGIEKV